MIDHRWVVHGRIRRHARRDRLLRPGDPSPPVAGVARAVEPASVMVRRPTPRLIADPCVAVIRLPGPLAVLVRRPRLGDAVRHPHLAVLAIGHPPPVRVELRDADEPGVGEPEAVISALEAVALGDPLIEAGVLDRRDRREPRRRGAAADDEGIAGFDDAVDVSADQFDATGGRRDEGLAVANADAIRARLLWANADRRGIDRGGVGFVAEATEFDGSSGELDRVAACPRLCEARLRAGVFSDEGPVVELQFGASAGTGREAVARQERRVRAGRDVARRVGAGDSDVAADVADSGDARWLGRRRWCCGCGGCLETRQQGERGERPTAGL